MGSKWTKREDKLLIFCHDHLTPKQMSELLPGRTVSAVKNRLVILQKQGVVSRATTTPKRQAPASTTSESLKKIRSGKRKDLNNIFFRSGWEANVARVLNHLGHKWDYEPKVFYYSNITRGKAAYVPDFYDHHDDIWIEVKGRMNDGDYGKLLNFRRQYPEEFAKLRGITRKNTKAHKAFTRLGIPVLWFYDDLNKQYNTILKGWE